MTLLLAVVIVGLALLVGLAWAICVCAGRADRAWDRINHERERRG